MLAGEAVGASFLRVSAVRRGDCTYSVQLLLSAVQAGITLVTVQCTLHGQLLLSAVQAGITLVTELQWGGGGFRSFVSAAFFGEI
jgi:hypothetical protein